MSRSLCDMDGCDRLKKFAASGFGDMHEGRRRKGFALDAPYRLPGRNFENHFVKTEGCWEWTAYRAKHGYGRYGAGWAHRVSYETYVGPIPAGFHIDHLCRNRGCVNPAHLEAVTPGENHRRALPYMREARARRRVTACKWGHDFSPENTRVTAAGKRACRTCERDRSKRKWLERKAA